MPILMSMATKLISISVLILTSVYLSMLTAFVGASQKIIWSYFCWKWSPKSCWCSCCWRRCWSYCYCKRCQRSRCCSYCQSWHQNCCCGSWRWRNCWSWSYCQSRRWRIRWCSCYRIRCQSCFCRSWGLGICQSPLSEPASEDSLVLRLLGPGARAAFFGAGVGEYVDACCRSWSRIC